MTLVHLVQGRMAEASLSAANKGEVIGVTDDLTYGPCSLSPRRHAVLRRRFWGAEAANGPGPRWLSPERMESAEAQVFGADELRPRLDAMPADLRVVLWVSDHWREVLFACWAADALRRVGVPENRVLVGRPLAPKQPVAWMGESEFARATQTAKPMRANWMAGALMVWRSYCRSPGEIEKLRSSPGTALPRLSSGVRNYADLLPRAEGRARPRLSRLDDAILGALSATEWRGYPELFRTPNSRMSRFVNVFGDLPVSRTWQWSRHRRGKFVERAAEGVGETGPRFRLTGAGADLLRTGLAQFDDAPPLWVGGHSVFGRTNRWVVVQRGSSWQIKQAAPG
jgi:hypothetical protein